MKYKTVRLEYYKAYHEYLKELRLLLKTYSLRELLRCCPDIDIYQLRLASETAHQDMDTTVDPHIQHLLRHLPLNEQKKWLNKTKINEWTPMVLRKQLRGNVKPLTKETVGINTTTKTLRKQWLNARIARTDAQSHEKKNYY